MWPFSRKPERSGAPETAPGPPLIHFDWKGLPSIQRTIADHPLTVSTESFASGLVTHEDPRAIAEPLGHQVSLEAPPGIVLGIARPESHSDGPPLIPRARPVHRAPPVQRVIDESVAREAETPEVERMEEEHAGTPVVPLRRLAASSEPLPSVQLTRVSAETEPTPLASEVVTPSEEPPPPTEGDQSLDATTTEVPSFPRLTLGQARRLGLGAPIKRVPETATSVQRVSEVSTRPEPPGHRDSRGREEEPPQFQTFELDYLVNKRPEIKAPAPISRPQRIALPLARSAAPAPSPEAPPSAPPAMEPSNSSETGTAEPAQPAAAVQRSAEHEAAEEVPVQTASIAVDETPVREIAGPGIAAATDPRRMLLTDAPKGEADQSEGEAEPPLPLALSASTERPAAVTHFDVSPTARAAGISTTDQAPPGSLRDGTRLAPLVSERPQMLTHTDPPVAASVQRAPEAAPPLVPRASAGAPTPLKRVTGEAPSTMRSAPPGARVDATTSLAAPSFLTADAPSFAVSSLPEVSAALRLPLAREPGYASATLSLQRTASTPAASDAVSWSPVQTSTAVTEHEIAETAAAPASIQRAAVQEWTVSGAADTSGTSLVHAGDAQAATPGGNDDEQMEHLAAKLYDRIRGRLRNELLVDRERAGFLTDLR